MCTRQRHRPADRGGGGPRPAASSSERLPAGVAPPAVGTPAPSWPLLQRDRPTDRPKERKVSEMPSAYIVEAVRTAGGRQRGALREWHPISIGAKVVDAVVARAGIDGALVEDVIVGCVSQVGAQAGNIGRNIVLASNLPEHVPGTAVDRQCGSSQQAIHFAAQAVMSGVQDVVIAAGVEHMTGVPIGANVADAVPAGHGVPNSDEIKAKYGAALEERGQKFFSQVSGP